MLPLEVGGERRKDAGSKWQNVLLERCLPGARIPLQKGSGDLGPQCAGKKFTPVPGEWRVRVAAALQAELQDFSKRLYKICVTVKKDLAVDWGRVCLQAVPGVCRRLCTW